MCSNIKSINQYSLKIKLLTDGFVFFFSFLFVESILIKKKLKKFNTRLIYSKLEDLKSINFPEKFINDINLFVLFTYEINFDKYFDYLSKFISSISGNLDFFSFKFFLSGIINFNSFLIVFFFFKYFRLYSYK